MQFVIGKSYSRPQVKEIAGIGRSAKGGNWDTGIVEHQGEFIIFTNIGTEGRTGHNYGNQWEGPLLRWYHKSGSHLAWPSVRNLLSPRSRIHLFLRTRNNDPFTYAGLAKAVEVADTSPVEILWRFDEVVLGPLLVETPDELPVSAYHEGTAKQVLVNAYERDPVARQTCLDHYGFMCAVCDFSFEEKFGKLGASYMHVHHLIPIATIGQDYAVDPIADLRPVCPNCHVMLHRRRPPLSIEELKAIILENYESG